MVLTFHRGKVTDKDAQIEGDLQRARLGARVLVAAPFQQQLVQMVELFLVPRTVQSHVCAVAFKSLGAYKYCSPCCLQLKR